MLRWLVAGLVALAVSTAPMASASRVPAVLVQLQHRVLAVAQDGPRIAWAVGPCGSVTIRDLRARRNYGFSGSLCEVPGNFGAIAIAGSRAAWWTDWHGDSYHQDLGYGTFGGKSNDPATETDLTECGSFGDGDVITGLQAAGGSVLYGHLTITSKSGDPCAPPVTKSGEVLDAFTARPGHPVPGLPPAILFAASGANVAVLPIDTSSSSDVAGPGANTPVLVYDTTTGRQVASAAVQGTARMLALSSNVLAVLASSPTGFRIERFDPASGSALGTVRVSKTTADMSASGHALVYHTGRQIWVVDGGNGKPTLLVTAAAPPVGLSVQGGRVVWGENIDGRGRIVSLTLPAASGH